MPRLNVADEMTTPIKGLLWGTFCFALPALLSAVWAQPADAVRKEPTGLVVADEAGGAPAQAQGRREKKKRNGGLLDDIGLGSLDEIPWDAFGLGMILSALVGAGGGFIYAGIAEPREKAEP